MDDAWVETQWTDEAKQAYAARSETLIEAIRQHVELTVSRSGRQREMAPYFESADNLMSAAHAFNEAEFDWCGSFPLGLTSDDDEEEDDEDWEDQEPGGGAVLSVLGRWDFRITDEAAVVRAGRASYLDTWPEDTPDDAAVRVVDVESAASELIHASGPGALEGVDGLRAERDILFTVTHDGDDDETFEADPFAINNA